MVLDDRSFIEEVVQDIRNLRRNAEWAVREAADRYAQILASVEDDYLRERVVDVKDVARRILRNLQGGAAFSVGDLDRKHIVVAHDLEPSETAAMRRDTVLGFATDMGSPTSHTAVMARALEIPAIVALHDITQRVTTGDEVLIDGNKGILIINPTPDQLEQYGRLAASRRKIERRFEGFRDRPAETPDGHRVTLSANIEGPEELDGVVESGAEGIGLFRSEFLYLSRDDVVSEEEQAQIYDQVAARLAPDPVIIRTLDLGGDKFFPGARLAAEANPFLGCRSIRLSLRHPESFKGQLRAILRASARGNVKMMYPMISSAFEVARANELLEEAKRELAAAAVPFQPDIQVGAMIEIPSAALTADVIAGHVRFFSLGTNDLVQYTLAVDRINENVAYLYEPTHPAVLKLVQLTIEAGHRHGIWVGVCGEMAADPVIVPLLIGLGVEELSVAPVAVPLVKDVIRSVEYGKAQELARKALACGSAAEVLEHCRSLISEVAPEVLELI
jgi:phosphotransferase system enzyme I (PtsI)